ncbi:MAG TPA: hypothetical protein DE036_01670 [Actinobacteria bacterium]|nr:hypothetical protein [Actinomycetota bacterium]
MQSLLLAMLITIALMGSSASAVTRSEVMDRAESWTKSSVSYSQTRTFRGYRTDCSGFVSYALALNKPGQTTNSLAKTTRAVKKRDLEPGDIIVAKGVHVVLFGGWANKEQTKYVAYEQASSTGSIERVTPYPYWKGAGSYAAKRHPGVGGGGEITVSRGGERTLPPLRDKLTRKQSDYDGDGVSDVSVLYDGASNKRSLWRFYSNKGKFNAVSVWSGIEGAFTMQNSKKTSGDFNGDNIADTALFYRNHDDTSSIWVFYSGKGRNVKVTMPWTSQPGQFDWDRVRLASGDFNKDGRSDLALFDGTPAESSALWVMLTDKSGGFTMSKWWQGEPGAFDWDSAKMLSGDFNGDGRSDLAFLYDYAQSPTAIWIFASKGNGFSPRIWWKSTPNTFLAERVKMVSGYFNRDDHADISVFYDEPNGGTSIITLYSNKAGHFAARKRWSGEPGGFSWKQAKIMAGDYNADGLTDLSFLYGYLDGHARAWMFENDKGNRFLPKTWWTGVSGKFDWSNTLVTDQEQTEG